MRQVTRRKASVGVEINLRCPPLHSTSHRHDGRIDVFWPAPIQIRASSLFDPSKLRFQSEQAPSPIRAGSVSNPSRLRLQSEPAPSSVRAGSDSSPSWLRSDSMLASFRHRSYPSQPLLSSPQPTLRQCFAPLCARFVAKASLFRRKVGTKGRKEILESHQLAQAGCVS